MVAAGIFGPAPCFANHYTSSSYTYTYVTCPACADERSSASLRCWFLHFAVGFAIAVRELSCFIANSFIASTCADARDRFQL